MSDSTPEEFRAAMITLTQEERDRFAAYCEQEAHDFGLIAARLAETTIPGAEKRYKTKAAVYAMVALDLRSTESMSIGGEDVKPTENQP